MNEETNFYKHQNQKVSTFKNLQRAGCSFYLPYNLVRGGLWFVWNITIKQALENRVHCKDIERSHKSRKKINKQALQRTKRKTDLEISVSFFTPAISDLWPLWLYLFTHPTHESFASDHLIQSLQDPSFKQPPPTFLWICKSSSSQRVSD